MEGEERKEDGDQNCSAEALSVVVNFMYDINIPEDVTQYGELLRLAGLFMLENLKDVDFERRAKNLEDELSENQPDSRVLHHSHKGRGQKKKTEKAVRLTAWVDPPPPPKRSGKCENFRL